MIAALEDALWSARQQARLLHQARDEASLVWRDANAHDAEARHLAPRLAAESDTFTHWARQRADLEQMHRHHQAADQRRDEALRFSHHLHETLRHFATTETQAAARLHEADQAAHSALAHIQEAEAALRSGAASLS